MSVIDRIRTHRDVEAMVALDTFDLIVARVRNLLSWDRRIAMTQRYTYVDQPPELHVGLTLDTEARSGGIDEHAGSFGCHFGVHLRPGLLVGFGFSAYPSDGNGTESEAWRRYHAGKDAADHWARRRNMTVVRLVGGLGDDSGPGNDDLIVVRAWNNDAVCDERVIAFDTAAYWAAQRQHSEADHV